MNKLEIQDSFLVLLALLLLADIDGTLSLFLIAAMIHEAGHYIAMQLCGGVLLQLRLSAVGAVMNYRIKDCALHRCLIALAGPFTSLLTGVAAARLEAYTFAGANILLGVFNLLPILPLDGGTVLFWLLHRLHGAARFLSKCFSLMLAGVGGWRLFAGDGFALLIIGFYLVYLQKNLQTV